MHLACNGRQVILVGFVMRVEHCRCDDTGRRRIHKDIRDARPDGSGHLRQALDLAGYVFRALILYVGDGLRSVADLADAGGKRWRNRSENCGNVVQSFP